MRRGPLAIAARNCSSELAETASWFAVAVIGRGRGPAAPSTTETGPSLPCVATMAIEWANAPLLRATLAKPQRSGAFGAGISKPMMMSPVVSVVA